MNHKNSTSHTVNYDSANLFKFFIALWLNSFKPVRVDIELKKYACYSYEYTEEANYLDGMNDEDINHNL